MGLRGGELDLLHYALQARRQVGSVSKLFFYESVWQLGMGPSVACATFIAASRLSSE